jgi:hypothetical protein
MPDACDDRWENICTDNIQKDPRATSEVADRYGQQGWQLSAAIPSGEFWAICVSSALFPERRASATSA